MISHKIQLLSSEEMWNWIKERESRPEIPARYFHKEDHNTYCQQSIIQEEIEHKGIDHPYIFFPDRSIQKKQTK